MVDRFDVKARSGSYSVSITSGGAADFLAQQRNALVLCDEVLLDRVPPGDCPVVGIKALEDRKSLLAAAEVIEKIRSAGLDRNGSIIAVGGGIVQDVACFVASVYMRGVRWSYLPTTVLGMVDSCIGGKSSINVGPYKNIAGTIHPPQTVFVDTDFARTLAPAHVAGGLCEAAKITFARGAQAFGRYIALKPDPAAMDARLAELVALSLQSKRWFVETDEFDKAERLTLNFGHTFGHALEAATQFEVLHGTAVGVGVLCALEFARIQKVGERTDEVEALGAHMRELVAATGGIGRVLNAIDIARFEEAFLSDKKHRDQQLTLVLPVSDRQRGLPLSLCRYPKDAATMAAVRGAVERTVRMF